MFVHNTQMHRKNDKTRADSTIQWKQVYNHKTDIMIQLFLQDRNDETDEKTAFEKKI